MAGLGSLYALVRSGGLVVAQAAARAGQSVAQITQTLGSGFLAASARAIGALAAPAFQAAQQQAFARSRPTIAATGYPSVTGTAPIRFGPHQYAVEASYIDQRTGEHRTAHLYYSAEAELAAADLRSRLWAELEAYAASGGSPPVAGQEADLPPEDQVEFELRGYYTGV